MVELIFDENEDWEKRTLCSDGSCIGTIGNDGRCKECGKAYEGILNITASSSVIQTEQKIDNVTSLPQNQEIIKTSSSEDADWDNRVLCSDGCCIGTLGPDGLCKECGKPLQN
jgi:hypothetical protein